MVSPSEPNRGRTGNRLLDRLPAADLKVLARESEVVHLSSRQVLFHAQDHLEYLYFPLSAVLSLVSPTPVDSLGLEIASVGNEGGVGLTAALLEGPTSFYEAACQVPGACLRLPAPFLAEVMANRSAVCTLVKKYLAVTNRILIQSVVCSAVHQVEQRICRWLLAMHEKAATEVPVTQDILAARLGVKRPTVSLVANSLLKDGLITYHRGTVRILDQVRLEQTACDCFKITKAIYEQILET
jgi:CRP-like cAMP-binding protein